jgi:peptide/nickel transport system ATP-binding protein
VRDGAALRPGRERALGRLLEGGGLMLELDTCCKAYRVGAMGSRELLAVRDVSFGVGPGEVVALIGESGSGKSTIGKMILRLLRVTRGRITFDGVDISGLEGRKLKEYYADVQGVFQDPFSSFNPIFKADRVFAMLRSAYFAGASSSEWRSKLEASLDAVSLNPGDVLNKYPHQLSGGQLQRMLIARALLLDIRFLVADEIISMLDASTRIDVLNLLGDLKSRGLGVLFITHDLSLGNYISDRTMILQRGAVVEMGATGRVFGNPMHPYTKQLLASVPQLHRKWADVEAELAALETAGGDGRAASGVAIGAGPTLIEVEDEHYVAPVEAETNGASA